MSVYRRFDTEGYPSLVTTNAANRRPVFHSDAAAALLIEIIYEVRRERLFPSWLSSSCRTTFTWCSAHHLSTASPRSCSWSKAASHDVTTACQVIEARC